MERPYENQRPPRYNSKCSAASTFAPRQWMSLGSFVRTVVELEADNGLIGLGEMGGGGQSGEETFRSLKSALLGWDPCRLEELRFRVANPTASLCNNHIQILAALEFACLDLLGQAWGAPISEILGGRLRDRIEFASYLFFRYPNPGNGKGEVRTVRHLVSHAQKLKSEHGFKTHKLLASGEDCLPYQTTLALLLTA